MNDFNVRFRSAEERDLPEIGTIIKRAIHRRKQDGSTQWQDGYPNEETLREDIAKGYGHVLTLNGDIVVYCALIKNNEPAYEAIEGRWLSEGDFYVVHRVAVAEAFLGQGYVLALFGRLESWVGRQGVSSIRVDTNYDNGAMLHILRRLGYRYCGEVYFRGSARKAFEKVLDSSAESGEEESGELT